MTGSDAGFAVTPYGEWHAREIGILVEWLGFTPVQALRAATSVGAKLMPKGRPGTPAAAGLGAIEAGRHADFLFIAGDPLADVDVLLDADAIAAVHLGGRAMPLARRALRPQPGHRPQFTEVDRISTRAERVSALRTSGTSGTSITSPWKQRWPSRNRRSRRAAHAASPH